MGNERGAALRTMIAAGDFVVAPGVFDGISARVADTMPFKALYMTGYGVTASHLGLPDAGLAGYSDMAGRARVIAALTQKPLIADSDTGYGGLLNVPPNVRCYADARGAATPIADPETPKTSGPTTGKRTDGL